jgi:hypothetical protein
MDKLMELGGYKNRSSAAGMYSYVMKQLRSAIDSAKSDQENGAAGTEVGVAHSRASTKKTGTGSSTNKRAPKRTKIKAEPTDVMDEFPDLEASIDSKENSARQIEENGSRKKRKSGKESEDHSTRRSTEQSATSIRGVPAAQIPGAQLGFLNHHSSSTTQASGEEMGDGLEPQTNIEPAQKKQKKLQARQDTPFERPGSVVDDPAASDKTTIDQPFPALPSPTSMQKLDKLLKYNEYLAETEEQRYMREQASIDYYGMSDGETEPLAE